MDLNLQGKRAIVTGASRGIGFAIARSLAAEGADVALVARTAGPLYKAAAQVVSSARVMAIATDTEDNDSVRSMAAQVAKEWGGIDILVNAAAAPGGSASSAIGDTVVNELREQLEGKVLGYLRCARAVVPYMTAEGWGRILSISGNAARQTGSLIGSIRNVSVAAMMKNIADEFGAAGINANTIHPALTVTERTPSIAADLAEHAGLTIDEAYVRLAANSSIGRLITADEVASVVTFLASPLSVAINGESIAVTGGARGPIYY